MVSAEYVAAEHEFRAFLCYTHVNICIENKLYRMMTQIFISVKLCAKYSLILSYLKLYLEVNEILK